MFAPMIMNMRAMDRFFDDMFRCTPAPAKRFPGRLMRCDISESKEGYDLSMELPGFAKEEISATLKDGWLNVSASHEEKTEVKEADASPEEKAEVSETVEKAEESRVIRRERFTGKVARSFYVGEEVSEDDISAEFQNGVLNLHIAKKEPVKPEEDVKHIQIA